MKKTICTSAVISALAMMAASRDSNASAFALYEQGVSGLGNSYAGAAAVSEDATTVWWNPAGMAWLPAGKHITGAAAFIDPSTKFSDRGSVAAAGRPLGDNGGDAGSSAVLPSIFYAMDIGRNLNVGFAINAPFGLKTEYDSTWVGRFQGIKAEVKTVSFNPAVSYRLNDALSVAGGVSYMRGEIDLVSAVNLFPAPAEAQNHTNVDGDGWGFNLGLQARLAPQTRLGVHYRSSVDFKLDGDTTFSAPAPSALNSKVKLDVKTPDSLAFSGAHRLSDQLDLLADITWWHWSRINQLPLVRTDGPQSGQTLDTLVLDFKNTWRLSAGANYKLSGPLTLKVGVAYDQSPVRSAEARTVRLPDNDRYWLSAGVKYAVSRTGVLDFGYAFVKVKDADINNNQAALGRGIVNGTYEGKVHVFGIQYQQTF
ncbi:MAG TPA: outer membrane protein transport protein [Burkholderiales bacterium]|nr:outer membrane protein transport protein [Burkholderiales bacterium]